VNLGLAWALAQPAITSVALLNNDAFPRAHWLAPLRAVLDRDVTVGAACPKVLLDANLTTFVVRTSGDRAVGDPRDFGVMVHAVRSDTWEGGVETLRSANDIWGLERGGPTGQFAWTRPSAMLHVALPRQARVLELLLSSPHREKEVTLTHGTADVTVTVGPPPAWVRVASDPQPGPVVNSAGTELRIDGSVADRGFLTPDGPAFDQSWESFGWSGAAVLLRRRYLEDVGLLDPKFFLYYEDAELAWRGRNRGWRYVYVPTSEVLHLHSATTGAASPMVAHLHARNRLVMLTQVAPTQLLLRALVGEIVELTRTGWKDVVRPFLTARPVDHQHLARRARVLGGWLRLLPSSLGRRYTLRRSRHVDAAGNPESGASIR